MPDYVNLFVSEHIKCGIVFQFTRQGFTTKIKVGSPRGLLKCLSVVAAAAVTQALPSHGSWQLVMMNKT